MLSTEYFKIDKLFIDEEINQKATETVQTLPLQPSVPLAPPPLPLPVLTKETAQSPTLSNKNLNIDLANTSNLATTPTSPVIGRAEFEIKINEDKTAPRTRKSSQHSIQQSAQHKFSWNAVVFIENPLQPGKKIMIDRKSWITKVDDKMQSISVYYGLDPLGYPKSIYLF